MGIQTNQSNAVEVLIIILLEMGAHVFVFHPRRYDKVERFCKLDSYDRQDVGMISTLGNQHLRTEPLRIT